MCLLRVSTVCVCVYVWRGVALQEDALEFKVVESKLDFEEKREAIKRLQAAWEFEHHQKKQAMDQFLGEPPQRSTAICHATQAVHACAPRITPGPP